MAPPRIHKKVRVHNPIGEALLARKEELAVSYVWISDRSGVSTHHIQEFMTGTKSATVPVVTAIAKALGLGLELVPIAGWEFKREQ